jgi:hypothetical protein
MDDSVHCNQIPLDTEDLGNITEFTDEIIDYGTLDETLGFTRCFIVSAGITKNKDGICGLRIKGSSISGKKSIFNSYVDLNHMDIVYCGIVIRWIGFGTAFELDNGIERIVSPYLSSGTMRPNDTTISNVLKNYSFIGYNYRVLHFCGFFSYINAIYSTYHQQLSSGAVR